MCAIIMSFFLRMSFYFCLVTFSYLSILVGHLLQVKIAPSSIFPMNFNDVMSEGLQVQEVYY